LWRRSLAGVIDLFGRHLPGLAGFILGEENIHPGIGLSVFDDPVGAGSVANSSRRERD
jgi:hypothetical protein